MAGGSPQKLTAQGTWLAFGSDAAWSVVQDDTPTERYGPVPEKSAGRVLQRLDLKTGRVATWYTGENGRFRVATLDSYGRPVLVGVDATIMWIVTAPGAAQKVGYGFLYDVMADSHGVWYLDPFSDLFYLVEGTASRQVGQYRYAAGNVTLPPSFAGPCQ